MHYIPNYLISSQRGPRLNLLAATSPIHRMNQLQSTTAFTTGVCGSQNRCTKRHIACSGNFVHDNGDKGAKHEEHTLQANMTIYDESTTSTTRNSLWSRLTSRRFHDLRELGVCSFSRDSCPGFSGCHWTHWMTSNLSWQLRTATAGTSTSGVNASLTTGLPWTD